MEPNTHFFLDLHKDFRLRGGRIYFRQLSEAKLIGARREAWSLARSSDRRSREEKKKNLFGTRSVVFLFWKRVCEVKTILHNDFSAVGKQFEISVNRTGSRPATEFTVLWPAAVTVAGAAL